MYEIHHRSEQGPKRYIDDFLVSLDHQGPRSQAKNEAASLAATWSWLGPIANKAAAYLGVKFSEKENESEHRPPYYASVVKNGVLIPQKAEAPYVALLVELCREGYDEGLELRKEHRAEAKAFDEMQRERKEDLGALDADVKETLRLIGLLSDRVETLYRRERQDFRDSESGVAHAQLQQERDVLGKRIKELKDQRSSLKGGDGLLARARELYYHSEIHQIDVELAQLAERVSNIMRLEAVKEKKIMEAAWSERLFTVYRARVSDLHIRAGMIQDQLPAIRQPYLVGRDPSPFQKVRMQLTELLGELTQLQEPLEDLDTREKLEKRGDWSPLADQELVDLQAGVDLYQDEEKSKRRQRRTSPKGARRAPVSRAKSDMN
jgi:cell division protein FtsB